MKPPFPIGTVLPWINENDETFYGYVVDSAEIGGQIAYVLDLEEDGEKPRLLIDDTGGRRGDVTLFKTSDGRSVEIVDFRKDVEEPRQFGIVDLDNGLPYFGQFNESMWSTKEELKAFLEECYLNLYPSGLVPAEFTDEDGYIELKLDEDTGEIVPRYDFDYPSWRKRETWKETLNF